MVTHLDWHHSGAHYEGFWLGAPCAPDDPEYRRLALKYASFYDGTCQAVPSYDPEHRVIRSINHGGAGPVIHALRKDWDSRGGEFWDAWLECGHDGPINLITTCFGTAALMLTGDPECRPRTILSIHRATAGGTAGTASSGTASAAAWKPLTAFPDPGVLPGEFPARGGKVRTLPDGVYVIEEPRRTRDQILAYILDAFFAPH